MKHLFKDESRLLIALLALVLLLNVPYGRLVLYPFLIFSTWVHECCHGLAALSVGGSIEWLKLFPDGSGVALTSRPATRLANAWVASAGYLGTAAVGAIMLAARRLPHIGRVGTTGLGVLMGLSALLFVRNLFGLAATLVLAVGLITAGLKLRRESASELFTFLSATCCLNAFTSIQVLFSGSELMVSGKPIVHSDAHSVAEQLLLPYWFWASTWMLTSALLVVAGLALGAKRT